MATDASQPAPQPPAPRPTASSMPVSQTHQGVRVFTFPKVIFLWPTLIAALICGIGMALIRNETSDPKKVGQVGSYTTEKHAAPAGDSVDGDGQEELVVIKVPRRFNSPQNLFAVFFLGVFAFNMVVLSLDFPRFTLIAVALLFIAAVSLVGWLSLAIGFEVTRPILRALEGVFVVANAQFYFLIAIILILSFAFIYATRWLDYWEVRPNEILHHHGPLSDLERFPTLNLQFDKEIPDVLEYLMLGAGRLVLRVPNQDRSIVLENVLWINYKEKCLKSLMSRMEVRVTTDQEAVEP